MLVFCPIQFVRYAELITPVFLRCFLFEKIRSGNPGELIGTPGLRSTQGIEIVRSKQFRGGVASKFASFVPRGCAAHRGSKLCEANNFEGQHSICTPGLRSTQGIEIVRSKQFRGAVFHLYPGVAQHTGDRNCAKQTISRGSIPFVPRGCAAHRGEKLLQQFRWGKYANDLYFPPL